MSDNTCRALRMVHGDFGYAADAPYAEKCRCIERRIRELQQKGYGGIVTNVAAHNYLRDEEEWRLMAEKARICRRLGMRMWLYDEDGYPSGAAGTQTLEKDPGFEARAAVMVSRVLPAGESCEMALPRGHERLLGAVCYAMAGDAPTDEELLRPLARPTGLPVRFVNEGPTPMLCLAFFEKHMYEGAHAQHNVFSSRRYIDVSNPDAVAAFIDNTYRRYTAAVGEEFLAAGGRSGGVIEAIFTDEPSYMGVYLNAGLYPPHVSHPYDEDIPLYPVVNWGRDVGARFAAAWGYRIEEQLTALFLGHGPHFCRVRQHFYQLMSDLYEQAFFAPLGAYCERVGVQFSGHLLLEDELPLHVMYEGNFFQLLRHMQLPGIDMLQSLPQKVWDFAFTPRLVRSVAELYGRSQVMDEVSAHAQGGQVTEAARTTSLLLQLAFGADVLTSYYTDEDPDGGMRRTLDTLARAGQAIAGTRLSDTLLFYPIETMMRHRRPPAPLCEAASDSAEKMAACDAAAMGAQYACLNGQKSFTWADAESLGRQLEVPCRPWRNLVVPACDVPDALAIAAWRAAAGGWRVIWYCPPAAEALFGAELEKLPPVTRSARTPAQLLAALRPDGPLLCAEDAGQNTDGIACAETARCMLLVNRDEVARPLCWRGALAAGHDAVIDPAADRPLPLRRAADGAHFTLPAGGAAMVYKMRNEE